MHKLAEREIRARRRQKEMDVKEDSTPSGIAGLKLTNPIANSFTPTICTLEKYLIRRLLTAMVRMRKRGNNQRQRDIFHLRYQNLLRTRKVAAPKIRASVM
jgi:hypothetical protein